MKIEQSTAHASSCLFCAIINEEAPAHIIYQNNLLSCFLDIDPIHHGHVLIVPKQHILDIEECSLETRLAIMNASALLSSTIKKAFQPDGVSIVQNGGYFNEVNHYHMHIFPRYKNDGFGWIYPPDVDSKQTALTRTAELLKPLLNQIIDCSLPEK